MGAARGRAALALVVRAVLGRAVRVLRRRVDRRKKHSWPIFIPGQSLIGSVATLDNSSVT